MRLLVLTAEEDPAAVLPALELLDHRCEVDAIGPATAQRAARSGVDAVVVDARADLRAAGLAARTVAAADPRPALLVVAAADGLAALGAGWGMDDWLVADARPAEVEARLRLAAPARSGAADPPRAGVGDLTIDEATYVVRLRGRPLDLTYREFELLKFLAANPSRVFTRAQLLHQVWGHDYFGGTRTVDVHVRRLRAKLGPEHEGLIGTVRGVGYKLDPSGAPRGERSGSPDARRGGPGLAGGGRGGQPSGPDGAGGTDSS